MNYKKYYEEKLKTGAEYEKHIAKVLNEKLGITLDFFVGKEEQLKGETKQGIEIKHDERMKETGNLYIEYSEKSHPNLPGYYPSGISRDDNTWLYIIGDYNNVYLFGKNQLKLLADEFKHVQTPTSEGFLIPVTRADNLCLMKLWTTRKIA